MNARMTAILTLQEEKSQKSENQSNISKVYATQLL